VDAERRGGGAFHLPLTVVTRMNSHSEIIPHRIDLASVTSPSGHVHFLLVPFHETTLSRKEAFRNEYEILMTLTLKNTMLSVGTKRSLVIGFGILEGQISLKNEAALLSETSVSV
jgi:hypothetical protein